VAAGQLFYGVTEGVSPDGAPGSVLGPRRRLPTPELSIRCCIQPLDHDLALFLGQFRQRKMTTGVHTCRLLG
jgi:hypothetical protein